MSRVIGAAARVILAAQKKGTLSAGGLAAALDDAGMLVSPERAAELETLRAERDALLARVEGLKADCARLARQNAGVSELLAEVRPAVAAADRITELKAAPALCSACGGPSPAWCPGCPVCCAACDTSCGRGSGGVTASEGRERSVTRLPRPEGGASS
ncbi:MULTISPECIES: hypothetical protein [Actinomycetes]|uniref:hypothetical protein n=1 Tax=Actinomycetes TaxID=1760 RepID=UPI0033D5BFFC